MPMRIAAPLLALLGHELRAPAGVVGGYLALLEQSRDSLTPDQQKALAGGARRSRRSWTDSTTCDGSPCRGGPTGAAHRVALPILAQEVRGLAATRGVALALDTTDTVDVPRRGRDYGAGRSTGHDR
jgi:signal transduction histidine kinase